MSVNLQDDQIADYFEDSGLSGITESITVACINSPFNCTLSGPEKILATVKRHLDKDGIFAHLLETGVAYHSPDMNAIASQYLYLMGSLDSGSSIEGSEIVMVSSVTGQVILPSALSRAEYWVDNLISPVRFVDAIGTVAKGAAGPVSDVLEIGPHSTLRRPVLDTLKVAQSVEKIGYTSVLNKAKLPCAAVLECIGNLFCRGYPVSVSDANLQSRIDVKKANPFLVDCPEYPFDHSKRYWAESRLSRDYRLRKPVHGSLLGSQVYDWNPLQPRWRRVLSLETLPWMGDHVVSYGLISSGSSLT